MRQLTLNISDSKFHTFLEFIKTLDYVEVPEVDKKELNELQNSLSQVIDIPDVGCQFAQEYFFINLYSPGNIIAGQFLLSFLLITTEEQY